jgi:hypothetical protein
VLLTIFLVGCFSTNTQVGPTNGGKPTGPLPSLQLEVDPALTDEGITVQIRSRQEKKVVLVFGFTKKDHDSNNYSYLLFDKDGKPLGRSISSVPRHKQGETFEWELNDDDLARASRLRVQPLGK